VAEPAPGASGSRRLPAPSATSSSCRLPMPSTGRREPGPRRWMPWGRSSWAP